MAEKLVGAEAKASGRWIRGSSGRRAQRQPGRRPGLQLGGNTSRGVGGAEEKANDYGNEGCCGKTGRAEDVGDGGVGRADPRDEAGNTTAHPRGVGRRLTLERGGLQGRRGEGRVAG
jgi:hypothetical protein